MMDHETFLAIARLLATHLKIAVYTYIAYCMHAYTYSYVANRYYVEQQRTKLIPGYIYNSIYVTSYAIGYSNIKRI